MQLYEHSVLLNSYAISEEQHCNQTLGLITIKYRHGEICGSYLPSYPELGQLAEIIAIIPNLHVDIYDNKI